LQKYLIYKFLYVIPVKTGIQENMDSRLRGNDDGQNKYENDLKDRINRRNTKPNSRPNGRISQIISTVPMGEN